MLRHLRVTNFAILSDVAIDFAPGMNALTGETGAGKSLIVEAVNLLRGGRASADIPRAGADQAVVEAIFEPPEDVRGAVAALLADAGVPESDTEVLIRRVIHRGGRSRTYVNGALTTAKRLAQIGALLVDLSGQHQHQGLVDPRRHRDILDAFAAEPRLLDAMAAAHDAVRDVDRRIAELGGDERARAERIDYLRFQLDEIEEAEVSEGEDEELESERVRLAAADELEAGARRAEELVYSGDGAAVDTLAAAVRELERIADTDATAAPLASQLEEARVLAEETARSLTRYADDIDGDPARLAEVEDRLVRLGRLTRKHGGTVADVLARAAELRAELDDLENAEERVAALEAERARAEKAARAAAAKVTQSRKRAAGRLAREVEAALAELGMAAATLRARIEPADLGPRGADKVELLLAANRGEDAKPLAKIASGGELSRIMLALKLCLRRADAVATYVFDEVDTGVGGETASVVGRQIRAVADARQVLCVTHLPQIAAFADAHFHVAKTEIDGRTETDVRRLDDKQRTGEMARMLGGASKSARAHATELLRTARAS